MSKCVETAIIEPNLLIRSGLALLLEQYAFRVLATAATALELSLRQPTECPRLVLIRAENFESAIGQSDTCQRLWPKAKTILLMGCTSDREAALVLASKADGCIPLGVTQETLTRTLDLVLAQNGKILMLVEAPEGQPTLLDDVVPIQPSEALQTSADLPIPYEAPGRCKHEPAPRRLPKLSEREIEILDCIARGYQNKVVARECGITESTVKVHMKSILRKIQVANRTQAAVWALENGLVLDEKIRSQLSAAAEA